MGLKYYKPTSHGLRGKVGIDRSHLYKGSPLKSLTFGVSNSGGRNAQGRITTDHRCSKHRKVLRIVSFNRKELDGVFAKVERFEYDPNRSAHLALLSYEKDKKNMFSYVVAAKNMRIGDVVHTSYHERVDYSLGNCMKLKYIKEGTVVYCVESKIGKGATYARSAGTYAQVKGVDDSGMIIVGLSSGEIKKIHRECTACIGSVSNDDHSNIVLAKAGANFLRGRRPRVRGIAMNPVDHPNGGRANGGTHFKSPTGVYAKGGKTRRNKRTSFTIIKGRKR
ncbi:50S ribosomal protein L2 [Alphaproteobacteria bacterium endosymbiont of Tiliacea citrago]|uniref:50S ribosomal protein L2 n=1 Tax=Alphaproteobacteria bacterium endosymbiont of Tiliacea citrago TaxID=3077944 RepID=UPI00313D23B4